MSKIAKPGGGGPPDQKKIYMDWANHYLRKAGKGGETVLSDLKAVSDGVILVKIIHAVLPGKLQGIHEAPSSSDEKLANIEVCVNFLKSAGVDCSKFTAKDIADGSMRAILSMFYNLSQFKKQASKTSLTGSDSASTSRLARPVSPGLKTTHGVSNGIANPPSLQKSTTLPASVANGNTPSPAIGRRTAGSSILTTTTYDKPYSQRRVPYKPLIIGEFGEKPVIAESDKEAVISPQDKSNPVANGHHSSGELDKSSGETESSHSSQSSITEHTSDPSKSKLSKLGKFSGSKDLKLQAPSSHSKDTQQEPVKSPKMPQGKSKTLPNTSKLQALKKQEGAIHATSDEAPEDMPRPQSRLKFPGSGRGTPSSSGRSTPTAMGKSGLVRPSSRLSKMGEGEGVKEESKLRLQRKGSDGAVKRHKVVHSITNVPGVGVIEPGTSAQPKPPPTKSGSGILTPEAKRKQRNELESSANSETSTTSVTNEGSSGKSALGLKKPSGGLKKPGGGFGFGPRSPKQVTPSTEEGGVSQETKPSHDGGESSSAQKIERKTSFSKLRQYSAHSKLPHTPHASHLSQASHLTQHPGSSNSSLDSADIKLAVSTQLDSDSSKVTPELEEPVKPAQLEIPESQSSTQSSSELISPPTEFKLAINDETKDDSTHPRYGRRISPEGMSHEEATSPRDLTSGKKTMEKEDLNRKNEELSDGTRLEKTFESSSKITASRSKPSRKQSQPETGQTESPVLVSKQGPLPAGGSPPPVDNRGFSESENAGRKSRVEELLSSPSHHKQRARSLSPKNSRRIIPMRVPVNFDASRSGSSEDVPRTSGRSPLKSSLRGVGGNKRHPSTSSNDSSSSSSPSRVKVVISPRSSQLVYDPEETGLNGSHGNHLTKMSPDRPVSFADTLSPTTGGGTYHSQIIGSGLTRHTSIRSTLSERLDYRDEVEFLERGMPSKNDKPNSNPELELIGTFENQLSTMREDLESKNRMLSMYETSMADLSSKVHYLKKTLDEKDREIRQLTDEKSTVMTQWMDLDGRSLASRAASVVEVLSDGCLSDSAMDNSSKGEKKKKKSWKFFKKSKKDKDHLSPTMDTESIMSGRSSRGLRRTLSAKRKTPDLMSISEYPVGPRYREPDSKSLYTLDTRSEYGSVLPPMVWADELVTVYSDESPGAKVKVYLQPELDEVTAGNDSGFYNDGLSRQDSNGGGVHKRDSYGSHSSDSPIVTESGLVLGMLSVAPETSWVTMDTKIGNIFMHHLNSIDQEGYLGLTEDSIYCYLIGDQRRAIGNALLPLLTPYQAIAESNEVRILMRGSAQESCDSLAYKTMMNTESLQSYMNMLHETRWLVVMGTKGTCKTNLSSGLSRHLSLCVANEECEDVEGGVGGEIINFNLDKESMETPLQYIKSDLVKRTKLPLPPPVLLLEDIYECKQLEEILVAASSLANRPYIVATLCSGSTKGIPLHHLLFHHQIRVITCNPSTEPVVGILARSLRKQIYQLKATTSDLDQVSERLVNWLPYLLDHLNQFINKFHSNVVNLGPRVFMGCPLHQSANELDAWFLNLWNYFIIPYLMGTIMAGIETYTADPHMIWTDVREWVIESYPWQPSMNINKLRTLNPEDVGWNHAVRPQQNRLMILKDEDTRSLIHA